MVRVLLPGPATAVLRVRGGRGREYKIIRCGVALAMFAAAAWVLSAQPPQPMLGNSVAGEKLLLSSGCVGCHRLKGKGSERGTDLDRSVAREYTTAGFVTALWNHESPAGSPHFTQAELRNLFAYALSRRYFEMSGDAGRGKQVFLGKGCAGCHAITGATTLCAPPVTAWTSLSDTVTFAADLWNHAPGMIKLQRQRGTRWAVLSSHEVTDLLLYLRTLPPLREIQMQFSAEPVEAGQRLFDSKRCSVCHTSGWRPRRSMGRITPAGFASSMWNHRVSTVKQADALDRQEMRAIFSYLWSAGLLEDWASPRRGRQLFESKGCKTCHGDSSGRPAGSEAPRLRLGELDRMAAVTALLSHKPEMVDAVDRRGIAWPQLRPREMRDLIAFLSGESER